MATSNARRRSGRHTAQEAEERTRRRLRAVASLASLCFGGVCLSVGVAAPQDDNDANELDRFMERVLARRAENRVARRQYVFDEVEQFTVTGYDGEVYRTFAREYIWYRRDGVFVPLPAALVPANKKKDPRYAGIYRDMPGYSGMRPRRLRPMIVGVPLEPGVGGMGGEYDIDAEGVDGGGPDPIGDGVVADGAGAVDAASPAGVCGVKAFGDLLGETKKPSRIYQDTPGSISLATSRRATTDGGSHPTISRHIPDPFFCSRAAVTLPRGDLLADHTCLRDRV